MKTYTDRATFLDALLAALDRAGGRSVAFGKYSPAPLPASAPLMGALLRQVDSGGTLLLVVRRPAVHGEWVDEVVHRFEHRERTRIAVGDEGCPYFPPVLVIDTTDVFIHMGWPAEGAPALPYVGLHLEGPEVEPAARELRRSLELTAAALGQMGG